MPVCSRSAATFLVCSALLGGFVPTLVHAQPTGGGGTAAPATGGNASVADAIANFTSGDREKAIAARQALIARLSGNPSAAVLNAYAREVAQAIMPVVNGEDPHAKLNAAIVLQRLADQTGSVDLSAPIARLIRDDSPAISSFGLRAAVNVLPRVLGQPVLANNDQLLPALFEAVTKHAENEAVIVDAYTALTKLLSQPNADQIMISTTAVQEATKRVVDALDRLIQIRIANFGTGTVAEPGAEAQSAVAFISKPGTWTQLSPQQQTKTVGALVSLLQAASNEMGAIQNPQSTGRLRMDGVRATIKFDGQALGVIANLAQKGADVRAAADKIQQFNLSTTPAQVASTVSEVTAAFAAAFPGAVESASSQSTTAPTTVPVH